MFNDFAKKSFDALPNSGEKDPTIWLVDSNIGCHPTKNGLTSSYPAVPNYAKNQNDSVTN